MKAKDKQTLNIIVHLQR